MIGDLTQPATHMVIIALFDKGFAPLLRGAPGERKGVLQEIGSFLGIPYEMHKKGVQGVLLAIYQRSESIGGKLGEYG